MSSGLQLIPLRCQKCSSNLFLENQTIFLYCPQCSIGYEIGRDQDLRPVQVYFANAGENPREYQPFWAFDARLEVLHREAKARLFGNPKGLIRIFEERGAIRFYSPAFLSDVDSSQPGSLHLTYSQPDLRYIHAQPKIPPIRVGQEDAQKIANYLLITSEIEQKDTLRKLEYRLELTNPFVIVIGF